LIGRWLIRIVAVASVAICVLVAVVDAARGFPSGGFYVLYGAIASVFLGVGWLIVERRPSNAVGPLLIVFGALFAWYLPADLYLHLPGSGPAPDLAAMFVSLLDAPMFILIAWILILFPDGDLPSPRWRWTLVLGGIGVGLSVAGYTFSGDPFLLFPNHRSPFGIAAFPGQALVFLAYVVMVVLLFAGAAALLGRWRRGSLVLRTQIKWVMAAALLTLATELLNVATFRPEAPNALTTVLASLGIALVPIAMGIAILRYRLYEIDRIISRSLGYALVTGILGVVFGGAVVLLSTVLSQLAQGQTIAVAASTLAVFALFQPLRRRVQRVVDHRFDRARYDADRIVLAFSSRLRDEVDLPTVTADLDTTIRRAIAPSALGIWLRADSR
jgi:hypothetical protein